MRKKYQRRIITLYSLIFTLTLNSSPLLLRQSFAFTEIIEANSKSVKSDVTQAGQDVSDVKNIQESTADYAPSIEGLTQDNSGEASQTQKKSFSTFASENVMDYQMLFTQNLTLIAIAVSAVALIKVCKIIKVPSIDTFIATAIGWLVAEIAFYTAYMIKSVQQAKEFRYNREGDKESQLTALKEMIKNSEELLILMSSQIAVYQTLVAGFAIALGLAVAEAGVLTAMRTNEEGAESTDETQDKVADTDNASYGASGTTQPKYVQKSGSTTTLSSAINMIRGSRRTTDINPDSPCSDKDDGLVAEANTLYGTALSTGLTASVTRSTEQAQVLANQATDLGETAVATANVADCVATAGISCAKLIEEEVRENSEDALEATAVTDTTQATTRSAGSWTALLSTATALNSARALLVQTKKVTLLECKGLKTEGQCHPPHVGFSFKELKNLLDIIIPKAAWAMGLDTLSADNLKGIFYFLDTIAVGVVLYNSKLTKKAIETVWVHPYTRILAFSGYLALGESTVISISAATARVGMRIQEYHDIKSKIESDIKKSSSSGTALPKTSDPTQVPLSPPNQNYRPIGSGTLTVAASSFRSFNLRGACTLSGGREDLIKEIDPNCSCIQSGTCLKGEMAQVSLPGEAQSKENEMLTENIKKITDRLGEGDIRGAGIIATSKGNQELINGTNNFKVHNAGLNQDGSLMGSNQRYNQAGVKRLREQILKETFGDELSKKLFPENVLDEKNRRHFIDGATVGEIKSFVAKRMASISTDPKNRGSKSTSGKNKNKAPTEAIDTTDIDALLQSFQLNLGTDEINLNNSDLDGLDDLSDLEDEEIDPTSLGIEGSKIGGHQNISIATRKESDLFKILSDRYLKIYNQTNSPSLLEENR